VDWLGVDEREVGYRYKGSQFDGAEETAHWELRGGLRQREARGLPVARHDQETAATHGAATCQTEEDAKDNSVNVN
jgi:hypothetical protein